MLKPFQAAAMLLLTMTAWAAAQEDPADLPTDGAAAAAQSPAVVIIAATPPTKMEAFEQTPGVLIVRHYTRIATIATDDGGTLNLYAVALDNAADRSHLGGVAAELVQRGGKTARVFIDPDEIAPLMDGMSAIEKLGRGDGPLDSIEARYQTHGHLQLVNVDDGGSRSVVIHALQIAPVTGVVTTATVRLRAGRLAEVRQQVQAAQDLLGRAAGG